MYELVFEAAKRILDGAILQTANVSAGGGKVYDWRTVKSGDLLDEGGDPFDQALLFVSLVGPEVCRSLFELQDAPEEQETTFGVHWRDPSGREKDGWILRDGKRRWTGTEEQARKKASIYQASQWEGGTTTYEARASLPEE